VKKQKKPGPVSDNSILNALAKYRVVLFSMAIGAILTNLNQVVQAGRQLAEFVDGLGGTKIPKADVLVAPLRGQTTQFNVDFQQRIVTRINEEAQLTEHPLTVKPLSAPLASEEKAREALSRGHASVVLWGWQDDVGVWLQTTTQALPEKSEAGELQLYSIPTSDRALRVSSAIDSAAMLSCLAVAHHLFQQNQYSLGRAYLERALSMLPDDKNFVKNRALNYYLIANRVSPIDRDSVRFRIEYFARSVAEDPTFIPSLNNLAKALSSESKKYPGFNYFEMFDKEDSDDIVVLALSKMLQLDKPTVIERMDLGEDGVAGTPSLMLWDRALELAPKLAVLRYNRIAHRWLFLDKVSKEFRAECETELLEVVKGDPTIPGAFTILGVLAAEAGSYSDARQHFENALKLSPHDAHLIFNLGQVKSHSDTNAAMAEYVNALRLDPNHHASRMGRALHFAGQRDWAKALTAISLLPGSLGSDDPAADAAPLLKCIIAACAGDKTTLAEADEKLAMKRSWGFDLALFRYWLSNSAKSLSEAGIDGEGEFTFNRESDGVGYHPLSFYDALSRKIAKAEESTTSSTRSQLTARVAQRAKENNLSLPEYLLGQFSEVFSAHLEYRKVIEQQLGLACPYILGWDEETQRWVLVSTVLTHRAGKAARGEDVVNLGQRFKKFRIYEAEPEISHFDRLYVTQGENVLLDRQMVELHPGESVPFRVNSPESVEPVILRAEGFYEPLRSSRGAKNK
jgi:tetratricopeptide (TPR) repeat protein